MALMDAGVPIKAPVAGVAMGLVTDESGRYRVLTDIQGLEDALGDMDFKVAGTRTGVTAIQMDIKVRGITTQIMREALAQALTGRLFILDKMAETIAAPRDTQSEYAPSIVTVKIAPDQIGAVIGPGGKVIRAIQEASSTKIDIEDDGTVRVASADQDKMNEAVRRIREIVAEPEVGVIYTGTVVKLMDFGAFVNFLGKRDGLVHISELAPRRVQNVSEVVKEGDVVKVKCLGIDDRGKVKLSMKRVDQVTGQEIDPAASAQTAEG
jgi:polyribonucleotide nucleotidyltransferase